MDKKLKPTIYIKGNILVDNSLAVGGGKLEAFVSEEDCDLSGSVVIEGDAILGGLIVCSGFVAAKGEIQKGGSRGS